MRSVGFMVLCAVLLLFMGFYGVAINALFTAVCVIGETLNGRSERGNGIVKNLFL